MFRVLLGHAVRRPGSDRRQITAAERPWPAPCCGIWLASLSLLAGCAGGPSAPSAQPPTAAALRADIVARIKSHHVRALDDEALARIDPQALAQTLDKHSSYLPPAAVQALYNPDGDMLTGVDVGLMPREGRVLLVPITDGQAAQAGLRRGDVLLAVDDQPVAGLTQAQILVLLRGGAGSPVRLTVERSAANPPMQVVLRRRTGPLDFALRITRPQPDTVALGICPLRESVLQEAADALARELRVRPVTGLVLDLRMCGGGLLKSSIGIAAMFLPAGTIVGSTEGRHPDSNLVLRTDKSDYQGRGSDPLAGLPAALRSLPLVVLQDEGTAAGAEFIAAALQDHGRAAVVGRTGVGKGSIQTVFPVIGDGMLTLTTAEWITPAGRRIEGRGVQPDTMLTDLDSRAGMAAAVAALGQRQRMAEPSR